MFSISVIDLVVRDGDAFALGDLAQNERVAQPLGHIRANLLAELLFGLALGAQVGLERAALHLQPLPDPGDLLGHGVVDHDGRDLDRRALGDLVDDPVQDLRALLGRLGLVQVLADRGDQVVGVSSPA